MTDGDLGQVAFCEPIIIKITNIHLLSLSYAKLLYMINLIFIATSVKVVSFFIDEETNI